MSTGDALALVGAAVLIAGWLGARWIQARSLTRAADALERIAAAVERIVAGR